MSGELKVRLLGGYKGKLGEIEASREVKLPFWPPRDLLSINFGDHEVCVGENYHGPTWNVSDRTLNVEILYFDDAWAEENHLRTLPAIECWLASRCWEILGRDQTGDS